MPFKNVSQPKRVAQIQGNITGASYNKKLGSVAMIGHNPTEVVIVAQSGGPKVFGTQLDDVSDIVLLSRDMAVVKSSDALWAVLDLAHKAKVEQIATDVKLMVGPQGESALGLKWDNTVEQLTPGKNEVAIRSISLRGDHRAVDLGEVECYAVVEGGEGGHGEFRVHPGATPEQGSLTKIALPEGSKKLDRVRGGKFLSAVYKRGDSAVCLVRRAGNRLDTKLVHLEIPLTDLCVADTSLIAVSKDGRVVLYDSDAISNAQGRIEPKSETHLGCQGEPRVIVVAHAHVFIGTSAGEVVQAALVRKQLMQ